MNIKRGYIDARKIDGKHVVEKNGKRFVNFSVITTDRSEWDEAVIVQDCGKDESGNYIKGPIIGGIRKPREQAQAPKPKAKGEAYEAQSDDVPF